MSRLRRFLAYASLALALGLGQHAAALHALEHAHHDVAPGEGPPHCEQHSLFASFGGALGSQAPAVPAVDDVVVQVAAPCLSEAALAPRYSFLSRAPPASPA